jgi:hypothetical protein
MKLCPHCGESLEENAARCRKCGGWVVGKKKPFTTTKRRRSGTRRLLIVAGLAALAWAVSSLPGNTIDPRELLDLKPSPAAVLQEIQSELEGLRDLQEAYHRDHGEYSGNPSALGFEPSEDVRVSLIATPEGWSAAATHVERSRDFGCSIYVGTARPPQSPVPPAEPNVVECTYGGG